MLGRLKQMSTKLIPSPRHKNVELFYSNQKSNSTQMTPMKPEISNTKPRIRELRYIDMVENVPSTHSFAYKTDFTI